MNGQRSCGTHTHTNYCSAIKKNEIMPCAATWMDLEMIILSQSDNHSYVESKKLYTGTYLQNRNKLISRKHTYGYQRGKEERDKLRA